MPAGTEPTTRASPRRTDRAREVIEMRRAEEAFCSGFVSGALRCCRLRLAGSAWLQDAHRPRTTPEATRTDQRRSSVASALHWCCALAVQIRHRCVGHSRRIPLDRYVA